MMEGDSQGGSHWRSAATDSVSFRVQFKVLHSNLCMYVVLP